MSIHNDYIDALLYAYSICTFNDKYINEFGTPYERRTTMKKVIIIINGRGGCGKDTLIKFFKDEVHNPNYESIVWNISSIDPIKEIAAKYGYEESNKDGKSRKFLSDLKNIFVNWNDLPNQYLLSKTSMFLDRSDRYMFVHIRERTEIEKYKRALLDMMKSRDTDIVVKTLLVKSNSTDEKAYGNTSDDEVESYKYDLVYENNYPLNIAKYDWLLFCAKNIFPLSM